MKKRRYKLSDSDDEEEEYPDLQNKDELEATASGSRMDQQPECYESEEESDDQSEGFHESEFSNSFPSLHGIWKQTREILAKASEDKVQADISIERAELRLGQ